VFSCVFCSLWWVLCGILLCVPGPVTPFCVELSVGVGGGGLLFVGRCVSFWGGALFGEGDGVGVGGTVGEKNFGVLAAGRVEGWGVS